MSKRFIRWVEAWIEENILPGANPDIESHEVKAKRLTEKLFDEAVTAGFTTAESEEERERVKRAIQEKAKTGAYWWICCEECRVIDWHKKHTSCSKCAEWDGYCWNSFRVNGSIFTGD